jgi:hypothetical protein
MKKFFFFWIALVISISAHSQDIIIKKTGDEVKVKIVEIGINEIKYKRFDFQDGPVYTISKADVVLIKYENGVNEVITSGNNNSNSNTNTTQTTVVPPPTNPTSTTTTQEKVSEKIDYSMGSYNQNGRYISKSRVVNTLRATNDAQIKSLLNKSKRSRVTGNVLATALSIPLMVVGTVTTLVGVGMVIADTNPDATGIATVGGVMAGTGILIQFINIGFQSKSNKSIEEAVAIYNSKYADQPKQ